MNIEITNDFSESEEQFIIELRRSKRGVPYSIGVDKYVFNHPMQFLKAMTDDLSDKIEKAGLKVLSNGATQDTRKLAEATVNHQGDYETQQLRTKALELALEAWEKNLNYVSEHNVTETAQRFYTYITKGE